LIEGIDGLLTEAGLEHAMTGVPAMFAFVLGVTEPPQEYRDVVRTDFHTYEAIQSRMRQRGVEYERDPKEPWFLCESHSEEDIAETLNAFLDVLKELRK
jgi:glutamate-1-semialdehyde 2,1-aminomutase